MCQRTHAMLMCINRHVISVRGVAFRRDDSHFPGFLFAFSCQNDPFTLEPPDCIKLTTKSLVLSREFEIRETQCEQD